jgi:hypothetical protein
MFNWRPDAELLPLLCPPGYNRNTHDVVRKFKYVVSLIVRNPALPMSHFVTRCGVSKFLMDYWIEKDYIVVGKGDMSKERFRNANAAMFK